jgi:hypothetical protein
LARDVHTTGKVRAEQDASDDDERFPDPAQHLGRRVVARCQSIERSSVAWAVRVDDGIQFRLFSRQAAWEVVERRSS